jgi:hypothetical protein
MTYEDILKMEAGREMDALIAEKVMGQTDFSHVGFFWSEGTTEDGKDGWDGFQCPRCNAADRDTGKCCKHYSTDIKAAWEVVEKITSKCNIFSFDLTKDDNGKYSAGFERKMEDYHPQWTGFCDSAPLTICRAALLVVSE